MLRLVIGGPSCIFLKARLSHVLLVLAKRSARLLSVLMILAQAQPAELIPTLAASHVHAALVLLNRTLAGRAGLCVAFQPL